MKLKHLITLTILSYTDFFGIYNSSIFLILGIPVYDVFMSVSLIITLKVIIKSDSVYSELKKSQFISSVNLLMLFFLIQLLTTPFRTGNYDLLSSFQIARRYLPYILIYLISYDILKNHNYLYYKKVILAIGMILSALFLINTITNGLISTVFSNLGYNVDTKSGFTRYVNQTPGYIFVILAFIFNFNDNIKLNRNYNIKDISIFVLLLFGTILQGYRMIFSVTIMIVFASYFALQRNNIVSTFKYAIVVAFIFVLVNILSNNYFINHFFQAQNEFVNQTGSFGGRIDRDSYFRVDILKNNLLVGIGFVHPKSDYAIRIGSSNNDMIFHGKYNLYSVDSGYLNHFIMYGIIGAFVFYFLYLRIVKRIYKASFNQLIEIKKLSYTVISFIIFQLLTHITIDTMSDQSGTIVFATIMGVYVGRFQEICKKIIN